MNHLSHTRRMITAMKSKKKIPAGISENNEVDGRRAKDSSHRGKELARVACHTGGSTNRMYSRVFIALSFPFIDGREKNTNSFACLVMSSTTGTLGTETGEYIE